MATYNLKVNGQARAVDVDPDTRCSTSCATNSAARAEVRLRSGQCGACTVHVDGQAVRSCVLPIAEVKGAVTTLEGLGTSAKPSKLQQAFIDEQAAQCGYCINGMIMPAAACSNEQSPSEAEIREALGENLCRCGTHQRIVPAVQRAAAA